MSTTESNPWQRLSRRVAYENPWIEILHDDVVRPDGKPGIYGVVHFRHVAIGVVPLDASDRVLLVGQFRYTMNHYSWVRIRSNSPGGWGGTADFLAGDDLAINFPYWQCSGQGQWDIPQKPSSILFTFPASCPSGIQGEYTFDPFHAPGSYPKGAILAATVTPLSGSPGLEGYKFPDTQCNAEMTSCIDPF